MSINNFDSPSQQCTDTSANITRLVRQQLIREVVSLTIRDTQHRLRKENISILCSGCEVLPVIALPFTSSDTMRFKFAMIIYVVFRLAALVSSISFERYSVLRTQFADTYLLLFFTLYVCDNDLILSTSYIQSFKCQL